jgi:ribosomal protein S18 acetylase RimI-like enzyme
MTNKLKKAIVNKIIIRDMENADINFVVNLGNKTKELWVSNELRFLIDRNTLKMWIKYKEDDELLVAEIANKPVGFSLTRVDYKTAEIVFIAVDKKFRKMGIGTRLLQETIRRLRKKGVIKFYLYVQSYNKRAINFYRKMKFKKGPLCYFMYKGW